MLAECQTTDIGNYSKSQTTWIKKPGKTFEEMSYLKTKRTPYNEQLAYYLLIDIRTHLFTLFSDSKP
jgi:hypothetical protein